MGVVVPVASAFSAWGFGPKLFCAESIVAILVKLEQCFGGVLDFTGGEFVIVVPVECLGDRVRWRSGGHCGGDSGQEYSEK